MKRKLKLKVAGLVGPAWRNEGDTVDVEEPRATEMVNSGAAEYVDDPDQNVVPIRRVAVETTTAPARARAERAISREEEKGK